MSAAEFDHESDEEEAQGKLDKSSHPQFLPSEDFARRIVEDARRQLEASKDEEQGIDMVFVAPSGPPRTMETTELVSKTRESVGERVDRLIATLAFRAAAEGREVLEVADAKQFNPSFLSELRHDLPVTRQAEQEIYSRLHAELRTQAQRGNVAGTWGRMVADARGLELRLLPVTVYGDERRRARLLW